VADTLVYDKKVKMGKIRFVLPLRVGAVKTGVEISPEEVISTWGDWQ
jgi:3-dehydroquinate synthetase